MVYCIDTGFVPGLLLLQYCWTDVQVVGCLPPNQTDCKACLNVSLVSIYQTEAAIDA